MSWLSPKRRKTTPNLKSVPGAQTHGASSNSLDATIAPKTPQQRPPSKAQPQTVSYSGPPTSNGSLFYAYARRGDDLRSRYLLTFASAATANDWWQLVQQYFPDSSRPGPQLFSFEQPDLLDQAWRHKAFEQLKAKWMFISFQDADNVGGAVQGVIPVQDAEGNLLGGSAPASPEMGSIKSEAKAAGKEISQLEQHFERIMAAVERNTEQIAALAERQTTGDGQIFASGASTSNGEQAGQLNLMELGSHLGRINDMLERNSQHIELLAKRQSENEEKMRSALTESRSNQPTGTIDMTQLSAHLDRIHGLLEKSITERKDSARAEIDRQPQAQTDFTPLTDKLGKVQDAMEQNSALIRALLEEGSSASAPGTPFPLQERAAPQVDLSPLSNHLENIHTAIEQQSTHMKALVGFASGDSEGDSDSGRAPVSDTSNLAPLGEHLEQIYNAVEDGNSHVKDLVDEASESRAEAKTGRENISEQLISIQEAVQSRPSLDMAPLVQHLEGIRAAAEENSESMRELIDAHAASSGDLDIQPLADHLDAIVEATEKNSEQLTHLVENSETIRSGEAIDLTPLTDRLNRIHTVLEQTHETSSRDRSPGIGDAKFIMSALSSHLSKIQGGD